MIWVPEVAAAEPTAGTRGGCSRVEEGFPCWEGGGDAERECESTAELEKSRRNPATPQSCGCLVIYC